MSTTTEAIPYAAASVPWEATKNSKRAERRAALRKQKHRVLRDRRRDRKRLSSLDPERRARWVGIKARTRAGCPCHSCRNPRRYYPAWLGLTRQEQAHDFAARGELREIREELAVVKVRGVLRTGQR